jgi:hypothetical protein
MLRCGPLLLLVIFIVACAAPEPIPEQKATSQPSPPKAEARPRPTTATPIAAKSKKPGPIPTRALNVSTDCKFKDETGYSGAMKLAVAQAKVQAFEASVSIPQHGFCRFDLKDFRQTRELPNVELGHLRDRCIVRVWEQGERVTVAFQQCQKMCSGKAWDHLWPILNDTRDGSCA